MKKTLGTMWGLMLVIALQGHATTNETATAAEGTQGADLQKVSYAIGYRTGHGMKQQGIELDRDAYMKGFADGQTGAAAGLTDEEMETQLETYQKEMMTRLRAQREAARARNLADGKKFLEENAKKEGWKTTKSGLQYKVITEGTGRKPTASDTVIVHYRGTLIDGKEFDSSYRRGRPATFPVNGVIKGWTEALQMMPVGSKWQIVLPPELAYGERGAGPDIGPHAVLCFDIELLGIEE